MTEGVPRVHEAYPPGVREPTGGDELVYVALGDSFASGEGAPVPDSCGDIEQVYVPGTAVEGNHCHRSVAAYPVRLWDRLERDDPRWALDHRACSGATTRAFSTPQRFDEPWWNPFADHSSRANPPQWKAAGADEEPATTRRADLVTITMAGNDLGFADIVRDCVTGTYLDQKDWWRFFQSDCSEERDELIAQEAPQVRSRLAVTYNSARENLKPGGQVLVAGYPRPFPQESQLPDACGVGAGATIGKDTMRWLNTMADQANAVVLAAARDAGVTYVDVADILQDGDHTMCADTAGPGLGQRWINRVVPTHMEWNAHPNQYMNDEYAARLIDCGGEASGRYCRPPLAPGEVITQMIPSAPDSSGDAQVRDAGPLRLPGTCGEHLYPSDSTAAIRPRAMLETCG